jgi:hypothetical protein
LSPYGGAPRGRRRLFRKKIGTVADPEEPVAGTRTNDAVNVAWTA